MSNKAYFWTSPNFKAGKTKTEHKFILAAKLKISLKHGELTRREIERGLINSS